MKHVFTTTEDPPEGVGTGDERGQSEVIGIILMVAIATILAAIIGQAIFGLGIVSSGDEVVSPQATFETDIETDDDLTIEHQSGDTIDTSTVRIVGSESGEIMDEAGIEGEVGDEWQSSESITIDSDDLADGETIRVVWESPNTDDSAVLLEYEYRP